LVKIALKSLEDAKKKNLQQIFCLKLDFFLLSSYK